MLGGGGDGVGVAARWDGCQVHKPTGYFGEDFSAIPAVDESILAKTWSYPNVNPVVFVPQANETLRTALSQHKIKNCN